jgi:DNA-binding NtrC family response regulator
MRALTAPRNFAVPARIAVVHTDPEFTIALAVALEVAGHDVTTFVDPMTMLTALEAADNIEILVTRVDFPKGKPNGIALARMALMRRPGIRVLITGLPEFARLAEGLGEFIPAPIAAPDVVEVVQRGRTSDTGTECEAPSRGDPT